MKPLKHDIIYDLVKTFIVTNGYNLGDLKLHKELTHLFTESIEQGVRYNKNPRYMLAHFLNNLSAVISWIKDYSVDLEVITPEEFDEALKVALFNFQLGEAPLVKGEELTQVVMDCSVPNRKFQQMNEETLHQMFEVAFEDLQDKCPAR